MKNLLLTILFTSCLSLYSNDINECYKKIIGKWYLISQSCMLSCSAFSDSYNNNPFSGVDSIIVFNANKTFYTKRYKGIYRIERIPAYDTITTYNYYLYLDTVQYDLKIYKNNLSVSFSNSKFDKYSSPYALTLEYFLNKKPNQYFLKENKIVKGMVLDYDSKKPVFARVKTNFHIVWTDSLGRFTVSINNKNNIESISVWSENYFETEIDSKSKIDTIYLVRWKLNEFAGCTYCPKYSPDYDRQYLETQNYTLTMNPPKYSNDTIIENKKQLIYLNPKPERYFQKHK